MAENGETIIRNSYNLAYMRLEPDHCYQALKARDARFDGLFFVGVSTTGIYCRPVCTVRLPGFDRCTFYSSAAKAEAAGYRPCLRCRPELAPGTAPVDAVRHTAALAVARIEAGGLAETDMAGLAAEFSISSRQLRRIIQHEYGVAPIELDQTRRLLLAKQLLTDTSLRIGDIAYASGFSSVRRFNHLFRTRYKLNPSALRRRTNRPETDVVTLKLGFRAPLAWSALVQFLSARGALGAEAQDGNGYRRTVRIGRHSGWIVATCDSQRSLLHVEVAQTLLPVLAQLRARLQQLFDLDANPRVIEAHLSADAYLASSIRLMPGLRVPGALDGFELAMRAVLGQQISVKAATTLYGRLTTVFGLQVTTPFADLNRTTPRAADIADAKIQKIIDCGLPRKRAQTLQTLAANVAQDQLRLEPTANVAETYAMLVDIPGIGPWTAQYIAMRALANPDAFPEGDLGLRKALRMENTAQMKRVTERWRPWRAYAAMALWHGTTGGG